jgi:hypothetical protein
MNQRPEHIISTTGVKRTNNCAFDIHPKPSASDASSYAPWNLGAPSGEKTVCTALPVPDISCMSLGLKSKLGKHNTIRDVLTHKQRWVLLAVLEIF